MPAWRAALQHWSTPLILVSVLVLSALPRDVVMQLAYTREGLSNGEWWRIISGQMVHLGFNHTLLNASGFLIVSSAFREEVGPVRELLVLLACMAGVTAGLFMLDTQLQWYVGLSGALYGLLMHHLLAGFRNTPRMSGAFLVFIIGKLVYDRFLAAPDRGMEAFIGGAIIDDAHVFGAVTGLLVFAALALGRNPGKPHDKGDGQGS